MKTSILAAVISVTFIVEALADGADITRVWPYHGSWSVMEQRVVNETAMCSLSTGELVSSFGIIKMGKGEGMYSILVLAKGTTAIVPDHLTLTSQGFTIAALKIEPGDISSKDGISKVGRLIPTDVAKRIIEAFETSSYGVAIIGSINMPLVFKEFSQAAANFRECERHMEIINGDRSKVELP